MSAFDKMVRDMGETEKDRATAAMLSFRLSREQREFVKNNGGASLLRKLVADYIASVEVKPLPSSPQEVIAFIGSNYDSVEDADDPANVRYNLTVHDLESAFQWWQQ